MAQAGESVGEEAVPAAGEEGGIGSEEGEFEVPGEVDEEAVAAFFAADVVAGKGEVEVVLSEVAEEPASGFQQVFAVGMGEGLGSEEGDEAGGPKTKVEGRKARGPAFGL